MRKAKISLLLTSWIVVSCSSFQKEEVKAPSPYFDVKEYFEQEIKRLQEENPAIEKLARLNGKKERKKETDVDWERELSIFLEIDITKPAMTGVYEIDSVLLSSGNLQITYATEKPDLSIREVTLVLNAEKVPQLVEARIIGDNFLYTSERRLSYKKDDSYSVQGEQDIVFMDERKFRIDASFITNI